MPYPYLNVPVSVIILTFNEESNIAACLDSCTWCDDVHVLDSGSTDKTVKIAQERGIPVHTHPFTSFGAQRNWAIDHIPTRHKWHFHLDADERFVPSLVREMGHELRDEGTASQKAAYFVSSKTIFMGRWLRYSANYPLYQMRLFHRERCRFLDFGHGQREDTQGEVGTLKNAYLHFNFSKGISDWVDKHNRYSSQEAHAGLQRMGEDALSINWRALLSSSDLEQRRTLKNLASRMPGRALLRFLYTYAWRGGWRDGVPGFHYSLLMTFYEYLIQLKTREARDDQT